MLFRPLSARGYLSILASFLSVILLALICFCLLGKDHFAAIALGDDKTFYHSFRGGYRNEIQDRDILYHNIGKSIAHARRADIIILGNSRVLFALQADQIKEFEKRYGVKIYNLGSASDASGEFLRRVIKRWDLKPKLWIIDVDPHTDGFFSVSLNDYDQSGVASAPKVVQNNRLTGYLHVMGRNLRWRIEDLILETFPNILAERMFPGRKILIWRNIENGNWDLNLFPGYSDSEGKLIRPGQLESCRKDTVTVGQAQTYLSEIGGRAIFAVVPHKDACSTRTQELAKKLGVEVINPPKVNLSSCDGGGHLDKKGAISYTKYFLSELEKTEAFRKMVSA